MNIPSRSVLRWLPVALLAAGLIPSNAHATDAQREAAIRKKLMQIIVPRLEFRDASIREAVDFLMQKSMQLGNEPGGPRGVGITLRLEGPAPAGVPPVGRAPAGIVPAIDPNESRITLSLSNIPFWEAIRYVADIAHLKLAVGERSLELSSEDMAALVRKAPPPPAGPLAAKLEKLVIPKLEFRGATLVEALDFLRSRAAALDQTEPDPRKRGVNLVYVPPLLSSEAGAPPPKLSLTQTNVTLGEVLRQIAEIASLDLAVEEYAVVFRARPQKR
jgi:hypothetical protein